MSFLLVILIANT